jgi:uncharacterized surface protein with fasciclin (FAS1) repeats
MGVVLVLALAGAGCSGDDESAAPTNAGDSDGPSGPACGQVPAEGPASFDGMSAEPVATAASTNPLLTTLATAVGDAGLVDTLDGEGPFTVFAPANGAFADVPQGELEELLADQDALTSVLTYHVVEGEMSPEDLVEAGSVATLEGDDLTIAGDAEDFTVDGAKVLCGNITTSNAVVYVIDEVLMPESVSPAPTGPTGPLCSALPSEAVSALAEQPAGAATGEVELLSTLNTAVQAADLGSTLDGDGPFVVFAPIDDAFEALPAGALDDLLDDPEALANVLTYHVVAGDQSRSELIAEGEVETVQGGDVEIDTARGQLTVNGDAVLCGPITVENGSVYLIDGVLTPAG